MQAAMGAVWAEIHPTVREVTGRPPRTLARFLADHLSAFAA
ncbi:hypothetical protein [Nocardia sp. NPDC003345]